MIHLLRDERGSSVTEFALVGPVFLMMIFLVLEGGRMLFTKQALGELAAASARYAALHPSVGSDDLSTWTKARGLARSRLPAAAMQVKLEPSVTCHSAPGMAKVTIDLTYAKGAMGLLPRVAVPDKLTAIGCFPYS